MSGKTIIEILGGLANVVIVLIVAPLFEGVLRKLTARIQSRQGPPLWQPYYDLLKLLGKEDIESGESPPMQRFAVYLSFAAIMTVACLVPFGSHAPANSIGDVLVLIYLLTLCGIATMLAGLAAGSTYSLIGMNREMMSLITLEPLLVVAMVIGAIHVRSFRLDQVLDGSVYAAAGFPWSGWVMLGVMLVSFQAFVQRVPFDIAEAETEIMDGPLMEYSGPKLALFKYACMAKLVIYSALFVALFIPWGRTGLYPLDVLIHLAKCLVVVLGVTWIAATHARYRMDQAIRFYALLMGISMIALGMAVYGY